MSNFAWRYYTLSFTCSLHFQWPWGYFKVTAMSHTFNWKCYVLIRLSWNMVALLSTSHKSWLYHYFLLSHRFMGANWLVSRFDRNFIFGFFTDTVHVRFLKLCIITTLLGVYQFIPDLMTLTVFQGHMCIRIINSNKKFSGWVGGGGGNKFLFTVAYMLCGFHIH